MIPDESLNKVMAALRLAESGSAEGRYGQVKGTVRGVAKLGAYGIAADDWPIMAEDAGLGGANWRDPRAQDVVVGRTVTRLQRKYGDWRLIPIAWRAGEEVADAIAAEPRLLEHERLAPLAEYASQVMSHATSQQNLEAEDRAMFDSDLSTLVPQRGDTEAEGGVQPASVAGQVLRRRLYAMRERVRNQAVAETVPGAEVINEGDLRKSAGPKQLKPIQREPATRMEGPR